MDEATEYQFISLTFFLFSSPTLQVRDSEILTSTISGPVWQVTTG